MTARRDAFDTGCVFVEWSRSLANREWPLRQFFRRWRLWDATKSDLRGDYAISLIFRKLPRSHAAIEEWFIVGIQFAQWAPEVADLPQWDTTCDIKNGEITTEHFRWAAASANFRRALESTAIEPSLIDELYDEFRNCRRPESEKKIQHLSNRLRYLAQTQDNQYPLSELDDATASPAVSKESSSVKSIIGAVPSLWPRADKIAVIGLLIAFMAAVGTYLAVPIEIYKAIIERLHSHVG